MKKITLTLTLLLAGFWAMAQATVESKAAKAADELTAFFKLDKSQKATMTEIHLKKFQDLLDIENLKKSDPQLYVNKAAVINEMTFKEIKLTLNESQAPKYKDWAKQKATLKGETYKQLQAQGLSQLDIQVKMADAE